MHNELVSQSVSTSGTGVFPVLNSAKYCHLVHSNLSELCARFPSCEVLIEIEGVGVA